VVDREATPTGNLVDNRVDRPSSRPVSYELPEAAVRTEETEITSRTFDPDRSLRALHYPLAAASQPPPGVGLAGRDRHPGVDTSAGLTKPAGLLAVYPLDAYVEARMSGSQNDVVRRPIPPAEQPARLAALETAVRARSDLVPQVGVVLGSGLGGLADELVDRVPIPFSDLPGWPAATAPGHVGQLLLGRLEDVPVIMLQGRLHLYEGNDPGLVVQPVLLMGRLGARIVVLTNAAGGVNPAFGPGTLMVIADHLNLTGRTPLLGPNADELGPRFPDLTDVWTPDLQHALHEAGQAEGVDLATGVYAGLLGPSYETPAEVRMLRTLDADAVGMSTVLEAIAARWVGLQVCGISLVTNAGAGYTGSPLTHEEVLAAGAEAGPRLGRVIRRFIRDLPNG
jgi:purine-nucleoside phosphorylase